TENQIATATNGDATIANTGNIINTENQIATATNGDATIANTERSNTTTPITPTQTNPLTTNNPILRTETNPSPTVGLTTNTSETPTLNTTQTNPNPNRNINNNQFQQTLINNNIISTITPSNNNQTTNTATAKEKTDSSINNTTDTQQILNIIDTVNTNSLTVATSSDQLITMLEENRTNEYLNYLETDLNEQLISTKNVREILTDMANKTGKESAVVYINSYSDQLQIILYTKSGQPIIKTIPAANRKKLMKVVMKLRAQITNPASSFTNNYLPPAQQLYDWLIAPISAELKLANIDTLLFSMDEGLRTLPVAVLHDGSQFLIEKYSLSLIPSVSLM
ncbi:CHAT domain-containing protein, partial [Dapis sp. BLCC M172]|uniref:CHAT domain-containing protein n=1 Tax=Dapis sp. BLCC M172 TaxID=2975281 RepID=UPI003CF99607